MLDVIIIGSGPYGISLAAHGVANQLDYKLLGYPMDFWKNQMPQDMFIRTPHDFVSFSDARDELTIHQFAQETGTELVTPLPRPIFVKYAMWFARKSGVEFTPELVTSVQSHGEHYEVITESGQTFTTKNVIIATGVEHYKYIPEMFKNLPSSLVSHTSGYLNFTQFSGKTVAVIGSGQSAWEAAGLLYRKGANVELIYRRESANYAGGIADEIALRDLGDVFYQLPIQEKEPEWGQSPESVAHFLKPYVDGIVPVTGDTTILKAEETEEGKLRLHLSNGSQREVDHVISASGFKINVEKVPFFQQDLLERITREQGYDQFPLLNETFESSVPGLYFAGPLSSHSHGPTFRFILGLRKTAFTIIPAILNKIIATK
ncbi:NAD(P)-binding domain-containing protein [Risungbinella massiliensis]|uniref:NAD(P)-binding domain-containing protein n=1 Tax=Risungbinella massiliensis TaxID=1329796 RepID=UPI0005CBD310|nr:NAD(P)-binding domain-containing protein [Risungbinella massiliensis]